MHKGAGQSDFLASVTETEVSDASELQKGPLICTPDVKDFEIDENCEFLITFGFNHPDETFFIPESRRDY